MTDPRIVVPARTRDRVVAARSVSPGGASLPTPRFVDLAEAPAAIFKRHRTGDVGHIRATDAPFGVPVVRKRLWYPTWDDRWRGVLRTTVGARSRVEREAENLERLADWDLQPRLLLAFGERRAHGFLYDSFLCTRELDARPLDELLREERDADRRQAALGALGRLVVLLHARGFADRDLHLRNVLAAADGSLAKIDSPFGGVVARWRRAAAQQRDRDDLRSDLAPVTSAAELAAFELRLRRAAPACRG